ncbi:hypothetical protein ACWEIJ_45915 [Lentzea sp. NPDC004789]
MVQGLVGTILVGMLGALCAELIRVVGVLRSEKSPTAKEFAASAILVLLGAGAALFGWDDPQTALKVAVLGAAFPLLFSAAVNSLTDGKKSGRRSASPNSGRQVHDYVAGRF